MADPFDKLRAGPIRVLLSAPGQAAMNELYRAFLGDGSRVAVAALAPTPEILETSLQQQPVEVAVVDAEHTLLVSGTGDVIQPTDGILGIGSGGNYAVAAARALVAHSQLKAADIVREALAVAADIDVYTNTNIVVEELACET